MVSENNPLLSLGHPIKHASFKRLAMWNFKLTLAWFQAVMANASNTTSAVSRALHLAAIVQSIFSHLQPVDPEEAGDSDDNIGMNTEEDMILSEARKAAATTQHAALHAVALVNRLWFAIAICLL
jgi:hypothetical protein